MSRSVHSTVCAAKDLKLPDEARQFYAEMVETLSKTSGLETLRAQSDAYRKLEGVPVEDTTVYEGPMGKQTQSYTLISFQSQDLKDGEFEVPDGLKKIESGVGGMPGAPPVRPMGAPPAAPPKPPPAAPVAPPAKKK